MPSSSVTEATTLTTTERAGKLYVVGTPIGNLGDITLRAVDTLRLADRILAEDTRRTRSLLNHLGVTGKPLASIEAHVTDARLRGLLEFLLDGDTLALVTDAGMPGVSDPGAKFVRIAREAGIKVEVVPGPSALTAAIALSGLVEGPFYFAGFLPRQGTRRARALTRLREPGTASVLFEAGNRTSATLRDLAQHQPERRAAVCRELTKLHEEVTCGSLAELAGIEREWRGEVVIVLSDMPQADTHPEPECPMDDAAIVQALATGQTVRAVLDASGLTGRHRRALYARLLELQRRE